MGINTQVIFKSTRTTRQRQRKEIIQGEHGATGFRWLPDGQEEIYFCTEIDLAQLDSLAHKAACNRSGKSTDGPLTVRVISRRRL